MLQKPESDITLMLLLLDKAGMTGLTPYLSLAADNSLFSP